MQLRTASPPMPPGHGAVSGPRECFMQASGFAQGIQAYPTLAKNVREVRVSEMSWSPTAASE